MSEESKQPEQSEANVQPPKPVHNSQVSVNSIVGAENQAVNIRNLKEKIAKERGIDLPKAKADGADDKLEKRHESDKQSEGLDDKAKDSVQKRIDKLTREKKEAEESLHSYKSEIEAMKSELQKLKENRVQDEPKKQKEARPDGERFTMEELNSLQTNLHNELKGIEKKAYKAAIEDNDEVLDKLSEEKAKVISMLQRLELEADKFSMRQSMRQRDQLATENNKKLFSSWQQAYESFPEVVVDGRVDMDSAIMKEALKILGENAQKPKFSLAYERVNPQYDHENGPYYAMLEAYKRVSRSTPKEVSKPKAPQVTKRYVDDQPLSQDRSFGSPDDNSSSVAILDKKRARIKDSSNHDSYREAVDDYATTRLMEINRKLGLV